MIGMLNLIGMREELKGSERDDREGERTREEIKGREKDDRNNKQAGKEE
jgi:hypothetical protein